MVVARQPCPHNHQTAARGALTPAAQASVAAVALTPCRTPGNVEPGEQQEDEEQPSATRTPVASVATRLIRKTRITAPV